MTIGGSRAPLALVVTLHWVRNFGASFLAWATSRLLVGHGFRVEFVDDRPPELISKYRHSMSPDRFLAHDEFIANHLRETEPVTHLSDVAELVQGVTPQLVVTGSNFASLDAGTRRDVRSALVSFDGLSARDEGTMDQFKSVGFEGSVARIPDLVMSLRSYLLDWQRRLGSRWRARFEQAAAAERLDVRVLPNPEFLGRGDPPALGSLEWSDVIVGSQGYVGVRVHPNVVALASGAPVLALDGYHRHLGDRRSSKAWSLLREYGLGRSCIGRWTQRASSTALALRMLINNGRNRESLHELSDRLATKVQAFLGSAVARLESVPAPRAS